LHLWGLRRRIHAETGTGGDPPGFLDPTTRGTRADELQQL